MVVPKGIVISDDFLVCLKIYESDKLMDRPIWFRRLVEDMQGILPESKISRCLSKLYDLGMIDSGWMAVDGCWVLSIGVSEDFEEYADSLYRITESS